MFPKVVIKDLGEEEWTDVWQYIYSIAHYSLYVLLLLSCYVCCTVALGHLKTASLTLKGRYFEHMPYPRGPGAGRTYDTYIYYTNIQKQVHSQVTRFGACSGSP